MNLTCSFYLYSFNAGYFTCCLYNVFHTAKRGGVIGTYGSYRVPYTIVRISARVPQYGYANSRTVKIAHNILDRLFPT